MCRVEFIIPGQPKGKGRPRMSTRTGVAYTPKDTVMYENLVRMMYQNQVGEKVLQGAISAEIIGYFQIPHNIPILPQKCPSVVVMRGYIGFLSFEWHKNTPCFVCRKNSFNY